MISHLHESEWMHSALPAVPVFAASFGFYLLLAGDLTGTEAAAGIAVAGAVAGFTTAWHLCQAHPLRLSLPPARVLAGALASLVTDTIRVGVALSGVVVHGRSDGTVSWLPFHPGGKSPHHAGRRALVTLLASAAPNGFVVDLRPSALPEADHALLVHQLVPVPPPSDKDWPG